MRIYATTITLTLAGRFTEPLAGVKVELFDRDFLTEDDLLGTGITDSNGTVTIRYRLEQLADLDERIGGEYPDLYVVVCDRDGHPVLSTRDRVIPNIPRKQIFVHVPEDVAHHALLVSPPAAPR